jgi:metal-responsive CopG/Arc/MetJ family transcriptional regulator
LSEKDNKNAKCIAVDLDKELLEKIDYLVNDAMQFQSRDDFIELACHEFMVRRAGAVPIPG